MDIIKQIKKDSQIIRVIKTLDEEFLKEVGEVYYRYGYLTTQIFVLSKRNKEESNALLKILDMIENSKVSRERGSFILKTLYLIEPDYLIEPEKNNNPFRWSITLGKKPRGLWRPPLTLKWWFEWEKDENPLNIDTDISKFIKKEILPLLKEEAEWVDERDWECFVCCYKDECEGCKIAVDCLFPFSVGSSTSEGKYGQPPCEFCQFMRGELREATIYLEVREGGDYSDVTSFFIEKLFLPIQKDVDRRIKEAYTFNPIEGYSLQTARDI